jgi:hypothetical protein
LGRTEEFDGGAQHRGSGQAPSTGTASKEASPADAQDDVQPGRFTQPAAERLAPLMGANIPIPATAAQLAASINFLEEPGSAV